MDFLWRPAVSVNLSELHDEIINDPLSLGYAEHLGSDADGSIADLMNAVTRTGYQNVPQKTVNSYLAAVGKMGPILQATTATGATARWFLSHEDYKEDGYDFRDPAALAVFAPMITEGLISQGDVDFLRDTYGVRPISRAEELFGEPVHHLDIANALRPDQTPLASDPE
jgi:hypothetical protein